MTTGQTARLALMADGAHRGNGVGGLSERPEHRYPFSPWVTVRPNSKKIGVRQEDKFSALIKALGLKPQ